MNEQSLFIVAIKVVGLLLGINGVLSVIEIVLSTFVPHMPQTLVGSQLFWGLSYTAVGAFLCLRSSWLSNQLFRQDPDDDPRIAE